MGVWTGCKDPLRSVALGYKGGAQVPITYSVVRMLDSKVPPCAGCTYHYRRKSLPLRPLARLNVELCTGCLRDFRMRFPRGELDADRYAAWQLLRWNRVV